MILTCPRCGLATKHEYVYEPASGPKKRANITFVGRPVRCLDCHALYIVTEAKNGDTHTTPGIPVLSVGDTDRADPGLSREEHDLR